MTEKCDYWEEARLLREKALEKAEIARKMEDQQSTAVGAPPRRQRPQKCVPTLEQMDDHASKLDTGSNINGHLEEVFKGQAQQAEFLQQKWIQQTQIQQALQQQVVALTGAIQQLAETQSEETKRKTSRG